MICKNCGNEFFENYSKYTNGNFCSRVCARSFASKEKRQEINLKVSKKLRQYELKECAWCGKMPEIIYGKGKFCCFNCKQSYSASQAKNHRGFGDKEIATAASHKRVKELYKSYESLEFRDLPSAERRRRILSKFDNKCCECGISDWRGKKLSLEIHHLDGDNSNNDELNLVLLCPNCHSVTENFRSKNKKAKEVSDSILLESLKTHTKIYAALKAVGLSPKAGNYARCRDLLAK